MRSIPRRRDNASVPSPLAIRKFAGALKGELILPDDRRYSRARMKSLLHKDFELLHSRYYGSFFIPVTLVFSRWLKRGYPAQAVTAQPWKRALFRFACQLQRALPEPIGTSVLLHVRRRP